MHIKGSRVSSGNEVKAIRPTAHRKKGRKQERKNQERGKDTELH